MNNESQPVKGEPPLPRSRHIARDPTDSEAEHLAKGTAYHVSTLGFLCQAWRLYLADPGAYSGPCVDIVSEARLCLPEEVVDLVSENLATWPGFAEAVRAELEPDGKSTPEARARTFAVYTETVLEPFLEAEHGWPRRIDHPLPLIGLLAELAERAIHAAQIDREGAHAASIARNLEQAELTRDNAADRVRRNSGRVAANEAATLELRIDYYIADRAACLIKAKGEGTQ